MNGTRRRWIRAGLGVGVGLALGGAGPARAADLVVAQVAPFSGPLAVNGEANYLGAKAYFDQVNAQGGVQGNRIRFVREDDQYQPAETVRLVRLVAERDRPVAFVNLLGSANVAALLQDRTLDRVGIPAVGVTPGSESLRTPGSPLMFHLQAGDRLQIEAILKNLANVGLSRVGVVYQDIPFGRNGLNYIEEQAGPRQLQVVAKVALPPGADDARDAVARLRGQGAQTFLMILAPNSGAAFVRDLRAVGDRTPVYGLSYVSAQSVVAKAGPEGALGVALAQVTPNPNSPTTGLIRDFQTAMRDFAPKGTELNTMTLAGYLAARVTVEGLRRSSLPLKPENLEAAVRRLRLDLGGYTVDFASGDNVGSRQVALSVIDRSGNLRY
ncbi:ABC transporter substrate-binding protein [Ideonella livida]|uniref:ABC transporter substrate-binding protein n=1 Tax=Ideonella livida TaxID=2707176 RepID=A0A7C9TIN8_9BURK|nr:ABC transporter substrate-binding protein [Ideonella livida]NDY91380.1 ABC transporter substrate-binding protein [Ideonella livida]